MLIVNIIYCKCHALQCYIICVYVCLCVLYVCVCASVWSGLWSSPLVSFISGTSWVCLSWLVGRWDLKPINLTHNTDICCMLEIFKTLLLLQRWSLKWIKGPIFYTSMFYVILCMFMWQFAELNLISYSHRQALCITVPLRLINVGKTEISATPFWRLESYAKINLLPSHKEQHMFSHLPSDLLHL